MQALIMTETLQATATFRPDGRPVDPEREHQIAFRNQRDQKGKSGACGKEIWCAVRAKLMQITAAFHFD